MKRSRTRKPDRFTNPDASPNETRVHFALAPFDRVTREMDLKWGVDRLPELVSPDMAAKWGDTMARLNEAITSDDPEQVTAWVGVALRGYTAMDNEATAKGAQPADPFVIECEHEGIRVGIMRDSAAWPAIKAKRPDLRLVTVLEVIRAVTAYDLTGEVIQSAKEHFPGAEVTAIRNKSNFNWEQGDEINF